MLVWGIDARVYIRQTRSNMRRYLFYLRHDRRAAYSTSRPLWRYGDTFGLTSLFTICLIGIEVVGDIEKKNRNVQVDVDDHNVAKSKDLKPDLPALEWETRQDELYV